MSKGPQRIRGTQDIWGEAADRFQTVVAAFERVRRLYGFRRIEVPIFEATGVFARTLGETTDVVSKEMYTFEDRGGDSLTLRPELTAGIARAYISEGWQQHAPMKVATWGPAFRYERPQKGRFRQFHQVDAEILGAGEPASDVELIGLAAQYLAELGLAGRTELRLNTLGDATSRDSWRAALIEHFTAHRDALSAESRIRLDKNPLRILDSKEEQDWPIARSAPVIDAYLTDEAGGFFERVTKGLDAAGIAWTRDRRLVRGLDYYRHTAFEFVAPELGAQNQVIGGGRYDGLVEALGGPATPAIGFASGIERVASLLEAPANEPLDFAVVVESDELTDLGIWITTELRRRHISAQLVAEGSSRKRFDKALKLNPKAVMIFNDVLLDDGQFANMRIKRLGPPSPRRERENQVIQSALESRFRVRAMMGSWIDSGADVKLFPTLPQS